MTVVSNFVLIGSLNLCDCVFRSLDRLKSWKHTVSAATMRFPVSVWHSEMPEVAYKRLDDVGGDASFSGCIGPEGRSQPTNRNGRFMNIDTGCRGNGADAAAADADSDRRRATRGVACQASVSIIGDTVKCSHVLTSRANRQILRSVVTTKHRAHATSTPLQQWLSALTIAETIRAANWLKHILNNQILLPY